MGQMLTDALALLCGVAIVVFVIYAGLRLGLVFFVRRMAGLIFVLIGVSFITFLLGTFQADSIVYSQCGIKCQPYIIASLRNFYGLNDPWYVQYAHYLVRLLHFDLGYSWLDRSRSVWSIIGNGVPISVELGLMGTIVQFVLAIPLGVATALRAGSRFDTFWNSTALILLAIPTYIEVIAFQLGMVLLAEAHLPYLPLYGWDQPIDVIAPVTIVALGGLGFYVRLMRTTMLEVLNEDYIRTARAKGLHERTVIWRHAFRNALMPLVTTLGPSLAFTVVGLVFVESFFEIPGIAYWSVQSVITHDVPVLQATTNLATLVLVLMNLVTDVVYGLLDPRIKVI